MNFKPILILLFVGILSSTVMADFEDYDEDVTVQLARTNVHCYTFYSTYTTNCTTKLQYDLNVCKLNSDKDKANLEYKTAENRRSFEHESKESCQTLDNCYVSNDDETVILDCVAEKASKTSTIMTRMFYQANKMQIEYKKSSEGIDIDNYACTMNATEQMKSNLGQSFFELQSCIATGYWNIQQLVPVQDEPTEPLLVTNKPPYVFENTTYTDNV